MLVIIIDTLYGVVSLCTYLTQDDSTQVKLHPENDRR